MTPPVQTRICAGDCLDILESYPDNYFNLIVTSPPYADNRNQTYGGIHPDHYVDWFLPRARQMLRVLKPDGTFILNIKEKATNGERHTYVIELILALRKQGWLLTKDGTKYIVSIKSGPNWGNSSQIKKMRDNFIKAKRILGSNRTSSPNIIAVNGCCYGKDSSPDKGDYLKLCGQKFWTFISGIETLYTDIIEPLGYKAKDRNEQFGEEYSKVINKFSFEFMKMFCDASGVIDWEKVVHYNSGVN